MDAEMLESETMACWPQKSVLFYLRLMLNDTYVNIRCSGIPSFSAQ